MQSAQRSRALGARLVVLDETAGDADVAQPMLVKGFAEPAAAVDVPFRNDYLRQICNPYYHAFHLCRRNPLN